MPSAASATYLEALLVDASELSEAHGRLSTGKRGRQWGLGGINRAAVVLCVSAWESYVEEVAKEAIEALRPAGIADGAWLVIKAPAMSQISRFNTPNSENTKKLIAGCLGLQDVTANWRWRNCTAANAKRYLNEALDRRHKIAHGANPRLAIPNAYSGWLPSFFRNLAQHTDRAIADHVSMLSGAAPW